MSSHFTAAPCVRGASTPRIFCNPTATNFRAKLCAHAGGRGGSAGKFRRRAAGEILRRASDRTVMLFGLFLTLGVAVLSVALRSFQTSSAQKLGALGILIATFLAFYFITGNMGWGIAGGASWL